jgi:hypothetical protein
MIRWTLKALGLISDKPAPKEPRKKMRRISVHLVDGRTVVHYGNFRNIRDTGVLSLYDKQSDQDMSLVAEYAPGTWHSVSVHKRAIQLANPKR